MIRGLAIFYPDGTPTQSVGIRVDVLVRPTIVVLPKGATKS
jgi:hypothetical protein